MNRNGFRPGVRVVRTGADLPHLGVQGGGVYEIESFDPESDNGLFVKGVIEGLDQTAFGLADEPGATTSP